MVNGITHLGKLNTQQLYDLMDISEYWLYPCSFNETSCITALEMLMSGVICLYYPIAGLTDTMKDFGIQIKKGNEIEKLKELKESDKKLLIERGIKYATSCSWISRASQWNKRLKRVLFYARPEFPKNILEEYITSLNTVYNIDYKTSLTESDYTYYDEMIYVH